MDYTVLIGGAAGQGMDTVGMLLAKILQRQGYFVALHRDYMSRIRGGHNFVKVRCSTQAISAESAMVDILVALNAETVDLHRDKLSPHGILLTLDVGQVGITLNNNQQVIELDGKLIAREVGSRAVVNTAALACVARLLGLPLQAVEDTLSGSFSGETQAQNLAAARIGFQATERVLATEKAKPWNSVFINGNEAVALGALAAGCKFYSGYPMTPATSIMTYLAKQRHQAPIVVEQAEDEIAAIIMALGASYAGVRAMTGSSGGGFALMAEGVSLAGITETPIVIALAQRPGPATGLPTRTEQGDLSFVVNAGHGEFPRIVISLRHAEDCFYQTARAFNLAEKYQIPVFLLTDQYLADLTQTVPTYDLSAVTIERHLGAPPATGEYQRYALTDSGISPRIVPGAYVGTVVRLDSDEHDEAGLITEAAAVRRAMVDKRARKMAGVLQDLQEPTHIGSETPDLLVLAWGSTFGPVQEAVARLVGEGERVTALVFGDVWPLPTVLLTDYAGKAKRVVNLEQNSTGQLGAIIRRETGIRTAKSLLKYDGRQWNKDEVYDALRQEVRLCLV